MLEKLIFFNCSTAITWRFFFIPYSKIFLVTSKLEEAKINLNILGGRDKAYNR